MVLEHATLAALRECGVHSEPPFVALQLGGQRFCLGATRRGYKALHQDETLVVPAASNVAFSRLITTHLSTV